MQEMVCDIPRSHSVFPKFHPYTALLLLQGRESENQAIQLCAQVGKGAVAAELCLGDPI